MRMRSAAVVAGLALGLMSGTAKAATVAYDFSFLPTQGFGLGAIHGTLNVSGGLIVGISGSGSDIGNIITLLPPGSFGSNDNQFYAAGPYFDPLGVSFTTTNAGNVNLYYFYSFYVAGNGSISTTGDVQANPVGTVPLPASAPLFGAALLGLAGFGYAAKRRKASPAA